MEKMRKVQVRGALRTGPYKHDQIDMIWFYYFTSKSEVDFCGCFLYEVSSG